MQDALGSQAARGRRQLELLQPSVSATDCPGRLRSEGQDLCCGRPGGYIEKTSAADAAVIELQAAFVDGAASQSDPHKFLGFLGSIFVSARA